MLQACVRLRVKACGNFDWLRLAVLSAGNRLQIAQCFLRLAISHCSKVRWDNKEIGVFFR